MYADFSDYEKYSGKKEPLIPGDSWTYWERQAEGEIDKRTMGRLKTDPTLVTEAVKNCTCELAELLYKANEFEEQARQQGGAGPLTSYSNDGESGTFDLSQSIYTEDGKASKVKEIIYRYLAFIGLLYTGVR